MGLLAGASDLPLEGSEPPVALEPPLELSPPVASEVPPEEDSPVPPVLSLLGVPELSFAPPELSSASPAAVVLELVVEALVVEVVAVVLVRVASLSAVVLLGGVISGVLRGVASETLLLPQAPRARPQASASSEAPIAARGP